MTVHEYLNISWNISKRKLKDWGIDPKKHYGGLTLYELETIAAELDITIAELLS